MRENRIYERFGFSVGTKRNPRKTYRILKRLSKPELVLATRNRGKISEIKRLLEGLPVRILTLDAFPDMPDVEENQPTLLGNALKKAREISAFTHLPALADDTGLEVGALGGRPGVYSARYAGEDCTPRDNRVLMLAEMTGKTNRVARFRTVIALVDGQREFSFEGACTGSITTAERGVGGFGYDPIFLPEGFSETFAEMDRDTKNSISHRGKALVAFREWMENEGAE